MTGNATTWMQEVPDGWAVQPLRGIAIFFKGLPITKTDLADRGIPVVSYGQVHSKLNSGVALNDELVRFIPEDLTAGGKGSLLRRGDLVFADTSEDLDGVGNAICIDSDKTIYSGYHTVTLRLTTDRLYSRYLAYLILTDEWRSQLRSYANGVKVFSVTHAMLKRTYTLIPPIKEQHSIVNELDSATKAIHSSIEILERQVAILNDYRKSLIQETVTKGLDPTVDTKPSGIDWIGDIPLGWSVRKTKHLASISSGSTPDRNDLEYWDGDVPWFKTGELQNNVITAAEESITRKALRDCSLRMYDADTVLVAMYGQGKTRGMTGLLGIPSTTNQACAALIADRKLVTPKYLWLAFQAAYDAIREESQGSGQPNLSADIIARFHIPLPPLSEQEIIVSYLLDKLPTVDRIIAGKRKQLETLRAQRQSLIYEYVTGKRRVV